MRSSSSSLRRAQPRLGTFVEVEARGSAARLPAAIDAAFAAIADVERLMSFHDRASDVSRLNREAHRTAVEVDPHTWLVLAEAERIARASDGAFDVTVAPELVRWGFLPDHGGAPPACGFEAVELLSNHRVRFTAPRWIDLGGIAKGYAVDCACEALERAGIRDYLVNAGGDLRVGARAMTIHLRDPAEPQRCLPLVELEAGALATSGHYFVARDDHALHPIVAPARRAPADYHGSISVRAARCTTADALTKVVAVRGEDADPVLAALGAEARRLADGGHSDGWLAPARAAPTRLDVGGAA